jgi:RNA recognition motif-containing protein
MNIYVGNLNYDVTEDDLSQVFTEFGHVSSVKIIKDRDTGRAKGFAFIDMPNQTEANSAVNSLDQAEKFGRKIKVNLANENTGNR